VQRTGRAEMLPLIAMLYYNPLMLKDYKNGDGKPEIGVDKTVDVDTTAGKAKDYTVPEHLALGKPIKRPSHVKTLLLMGISLIIILLGGLVYWYIGQQSDMPAPQPSTSGAESSSAASSDTTQTPAAQQGTDTTESGDDSSTGTGSNAQSDTGTQPPTGSTPSTTLPDPHGPPTVHGGPYEN